MLPRRQIGRAVGGTGGGHLREGQQRSTHQACTKRMRVRMAPVNSTAHMNDCMMLHTSRVSLEQEPPSDSEDSHTAPMICLHRAESVPGG